MCGRFDVDLNNQEIDRLLAQLPKDSAPVKTGELFPTNTAMVLTLVNGLPSPEAMAWGFPSWQGKRVIFNARAESAQKKMMFRRALATHPLVVPATGFYEWRKEPLLNQKEKFRFTAPDGSLLYLAGFWNDFPEEQISRHFTILTTAANPAMAPYHDRMPVLVRQTEIGAWLNGDATAEILAREPFALLASPA